MCVRWHQLKEYGHIGSLDVNTTRAHAHTPTSTPTPTPTSRNTHAHTQTTRTRYFLSYIEEDDEGTPDQVTMRSCGPAAAASTMPGASGASLGMMDDGVVEEASPHPTIWFLANIRTKYKLPASRSVISYSPP